MLGERVTLEQLDHDPHAVLARLREREPVARVPALGGWLVTSYELALEVMRDPARFTVDDPRFSTAQVVGPSMLSLDGEAHDRHREAFVAPFRPGPVREQFSAAVQTEADRLLAGLEPLGAGELRRAFAGPLAASIVTAALGLASDETSTVMGWYEAIVGSVASITAGNGPTATGSDAFAALSNRLREVVPTGLNLTDDEFISNAAVLLFGGIETTEGMIANAILHLLTHPDQLATVRREPELLGPAIEESLRLEPAAALVDRYATQDAELGGAEVASGDLVRVSIASANRDPAVFANPDSFDVKRTGARRHLAFAHGPHVCLGVHLARLEAQLGIRTLFTALPELRLDPDSPSPIRGIVFRKPPALNALWR